MLRLIKKETNRLKVLCLWFDTFVQHVSGFKLRQDSSPSCSPHHHMWKMFSRDQTAALRGLSENHSHISMRFTRMKDELMLDSEQNQFTPSHRIHRDNPRNKHLT